MSEEMKQKAIEIAKQALEKYAIVTHCNLSYIAKKHRFRYQRESDATFINILLTLLKKHSFRYQRECDVAEFIKKAFDKEYQSERIKWQCIVGRKFGMTL